MCESLIYCANTTSQTLAAGSNINFGSVVRKVGDDLEVSGGNIVASGRNFYDIFVNLSFEATAGTAVINVYKDGVAIPGATASITTAADTSYTVTIPASLRERCCCDSTITCSITGVTPTLSNAAILVQTI